MRSALVIMGLCLNPSLWANNLTNSTALNEPFYLLFILLSIALLPFLAVILTSFTKIIVVLSITRQAIGMNQTPPNIVIISLSMILTCFAMSPMINHINPLAWQEFSQNQNPTSLKNMLLALEMPIKNFLLSHIDPKDQELFVNAMHKKQDIPKDSLIILAPAFLISELSQAFQMGFLIYLPFLVIDMTIANILMALGMQMLSPTTISLPFKLLLFVLVDGFRILSEGLIS